MMETRPLGKSGLQVSVLGMGCWQYGGGDYWGKQDQKDVDQVVHKALDLGINYFDTAEIYNNGESERSLGDALKGRRNQAIIGSKISTSNIQPSTLKEHCEASLQRLQTDWIDLYMLHWPITITSVQHFSNHSDLLADLPSIHSVFETLHALQKEGKIRHIGVSNHGVQQMKEAMASFIPFVANELAYNLFSRAIEENILPYCMRHDIGVIGYMPLQQGLLTGKYQSLDDVKPILARTRHYHHSRGTGSRHGEEGAENEMNKALQEIHKLSKELGVHIIDLSLAWAIANKGMATTIVGSRNLEQLDLNVRGAQYRLSGDVLTRLNEITNPVLQRLGSNADYYESSTNSRTY